MVKKISTPIRGTNIDTGEVREYPSFSAAKKDGHDINCVKRVCEGKSKKGHSKRWKWEYINPPIEDIVAGRNGIMVSGDTRNFVDNSNAELVLGTRLTQKRVDAYCDALRKGATRVVAAKTMGIHPKSIDEWIIQGKADDAAGLDTIHSKFYHLANIAEEEHIQSVFDKILLISAQQNSWRGYLAYLEKRYPEKFGALLDKDSNKQAQSVNIVLKQYSSNEIEQLRQQHATTIDAEVMESEE